MQDISCKLGWLPRKWAHFLQPWESFKLQLALTFYKGQDHRHGRFAFFADESRRQFINALSANPVVDIIPAINEIAQQTNADTILGSGDEGRYTIHLSNDIHTLCIVYMSCH